MNIVTTPHGTLRSVSILSYLSAMKLAMALALSHGGSTLRMESVQAASLYGDARYT